MFNDDEWQRARFLATVSAVCALAILTAMVLATAITGVSQEAFEIVRPDVAPAIARAAPALRVIIAFDVIFLIAYTVFFVSLPKATRAADSPALRLGIKLAVAVALLDVIEDQHLLILSSRAELGQPLDSLAVELQPLLSQVKFHFSYLAFALVGAGLPRRIWWFSILLAVPLPILGAVQWAVPAWNDALNILRWGGFFTGLAGGIIVVRGACAGETSTRG